MPTVSPPGHDACVLKTQQQRLDQLTNRSLLVIKITDICKGDLASDRRARNLYHFILCFPRFGVALRLTNTFHPIPNLTTFGCIRAQQVQVRVLA